MKRTLLRLAIFLFAFFFSVMGYAQTHTPKVIVIPGFGNLGFYEFKPANYGSQWHPLIIFLHGAGEVSDYPIGPQLSLLLNAGLPKLINEGATMTFGSNSFVVLSPQTHNNFNAGGGGEYWRVHAMLQYAKDSLHIDTNRIYVTGLSMGGAGVWESISYDTLDARQFAAAAPIAALRPFPENYCNIALLNIPVWAFHNDGDAGQTAPSQEKYMLDQVIACTSPAIDTLPRHTYYAASGHGGWDAAYDTGHTTYALSTNPDFSGSVNQTNLNLYEWFLQHSKIPIAQPPLVNAGSNQTITLPVSSVTLTGTASGQGGHSISAISCSQTAGPAAGTIASPSSLSTTVSGLVPGNYTFQLSATDDHSLSNISVVFITVNASGAGVLGYLIRTGGPVGNCGDTSSTGRFLVYGDSLANNTKVYTDSARTTAYDGGYDWYEFAATLHGPVRNDLAVYMDGSIHSLSNCPGVTSRPSNGALPLGYIKETGGPGGNCGDSAFAGMTAIYGDSLAGGVIVSPDPQRTNPLDGGYRWFAFSPAINGPVTLTFAGYADGSVHSVAACASGMRARPAALGGTSSLLDDGTAGGWAVYPNPVHDLVNLHLASAARGKVVTRVINATGRAVITRLAFKEGSSLDLPVSLSGLPAGVYIIELRVDGKTAITQKILKL